MYFPCPTLPGPNPATVPDERRRHRLSVPGRLGNAALMPNLPLTEVEASVGALPAELRVDGLLGLNVLGQFRTTFEFDRATLVLR